MKAVAIEIEDKVDELLAVLDKDIQHIEKNLSQLNELRSLVIKRDDVGLGKLLEGIQAESNSYKNHELKRQSIQKELTDVLGCDHKKMTLSMLEDSLPEEKRADIIKIKARLGLLIAELKKEHLSTILLLSECARFNRLLLNSVFDLGKTGTVYYNSEGAAKQQSDTAFVNVQL